MGKLWKFEREDGIQTAEKQKEKSGNLKFYFKFLQFLIPASEPQSFQPHSKANFSNRAFGFGGDGEWKWMPLHGADRDRDDTGLGGGDIARHHKIVS